MKKTFIYALLVVLSSCGHTVNDKVEAKPNELIAKLESKATSTVSSYNAGSETKLTYTSTKNTGEGICNFNGYCSLIAQPATEINMGFHFDQSGVQIDDTLTTLLFSKFMDLNNVKSIRMDSLDYKLVDNEIKIKFIVSLVRDESDHLKVVDKYSMVYLTGFENPKPRMVLDKIERNSVEIIGNTY